MNEKPPKRPYCFACRHFYITYDPAKPYGCQAMSFKSTYNPALVVFSSSGLNCQLFLAKNRNRQDRDG
ncbi:MAG: uracil-DNA glycosylase [Desulfobulbaceae bacterium]|nr:MAG: uracil-DNA glycosylase [Desulfobulbaceae bacterium]